VLPSGITYAPAVVSNFGSAVVMGVRRVRGFGLANLDVGLLELKM